MDIEDELLSVLATVIIQRKKLRKRSKSTGDGFSGFTEKERESDLLKHESRVPSYELNA